MTRRLYSLLIYLAVPIAFGVVLWRGFGNRRYWRGLAQRFGFGRRLDAPSIWLHAVSLGEVSAAAPLARALRARYPDRTLVLTTATPTGRERAQALFGADADVRYLPYDTPGAVARFLGRIRPDAAIIMETELWPNLFAACKRRAIPLLLANARLSAKSVSRYRKFAGLVGPLFSSNVSIAAQSAADAERFTAIGAAPVQVQVLGNIKFDVDVSCAAAERGRAPRTSLGSERPVWIAGSTHEGEEQQVLLAHREVWLRHPGALLMLAPRHPERFDAVAQLIVQMGFRCSRRSGGPATPAPTSDPEVLLVDTVGELGCLYAAADVAFVGGSLVPVGGHNLLEPAALGIAVLTGPSHSNGKDVARLLLGDGAALEVHDARELGNVVARLLQDPAERQRMGEIGRRIVEANRGSTARLLALIESLPAASRPQSRPADHSASPSTGH